MQSSCATPITPLAALRAIGLTQATTRPFSPAIPLPSHLTISECASSLAASASFTLTFTAALSAWALADFCRAPWSRGEVVPPACAVAWGRREGKRQDCEMRSEGNEDAVHVHSREREEVSRRGEEGGEQRR
jgi:hypothetical protein